MNLRQHINRKKKERDSLADFLREYENNSKKKNDEPLSMDDILKLCGEITRLNNKIKELESKPMSNTDKEVLFFEIEQPSKLNSMKEARYNFNVKKRKMPVIESNWTRTI